MPALMLCPGPIDHYVVIGANTFYLGTAETAPEVESNPAYLNVMNDQGGRSVPFQKVYDRQQAFVSTVLNRFDYGVYSAIKALPQGGTPGTDSSGFPGILTLGVTDFKLLMISSFWNNAINLVGGVSQLPQGRMYYSSLVAGWKETTVGTRVLTVALAFECNSIWSASTRAFSLYTENSANFPAFTPN